MRHLRLGVTGAGRRSLGERLLQSGKIVPGQCERESAKRLGELITAAGPDERHDIVASRKNPSNGDLGHRRVSGVRDAFYRLDEREVLVDVFGVKARNMSAEILRLECLLFRPVAADEPPRQHAVSGDANAKGAAGRKDGVLDAARNQ